MKSRQLEKRLGNRIDEKDPLMSWIQRHAANCVSRYRIMDYGRTPDQRRCGKTWKRPVVEFGESVHFRPVGENNAMRCGDQRMLRGVYVGTSREIRCRDLSHARWCEEGNENCENVGTREMGSRVQCNVHWSSLAVEAGSTESGETYGTRGRGRSRRCSCDRDACRSQNRSEEIRHEERSREVRIHRRMPSMHAVGVRHAQCESSS